MSKRSIGFLTTALVAVFLAAVGVQALDDDDKGDEREISLKEAPEAIRKALEGVDVDEIEVETENGQTVYDVVLEIDDLEIELELTADAKLIGVEIEDEDDSNDDDDEE